MRSAPAAEARRAPAAFATLVAAALSGACALEEPPPGARPDRTPPSVRELRPEPSAVVPGFRGDAEIRFDEPVSGTSGLERRLRASPAYRYEVKAGFSNIKIKQRDGWRDGVVYYFEIPPGITDLLGNRTERPITLLFSTGPPVPDTRVEGTMIQRTDAAPVPDGRVLFLSETGDSIPYTAVSDRAGEFALPALPPDRYRALAFVDRNANLVLDRILEPFDSTTFELAPSATVVLPFELVEPDSTPPVFVRGEVVDSLRMVLEFDDYLDPDQDFSAVTVTVRREESGEVWEVVDVTLHDAAFEAEAARRARRPIEQPDTPAPDTVETAAGTDTTGVEAVVDTAAVGEAAADTSLADSLAAGAAAQPDTVVADTTRQVLPAQTLRVEVDRPLSVGTYRVSVEGVLNLRELPGGGDTLVVYEGEPETPEAAGDTAGAPQDTAAAAPSAPNGAPPDTLRPTPAPSDTAATPQDTASSARRGPTAGRGSARVMSRGRRDTRPRPLDDHTTRGPPRAAREMAR